MAFRLRIIAGKGEGRDFVFRQQRVTIGRMPDNDLVLYDTGVSRHHCEISEDAAGYVLEDTSSANGTLLNGVPTTAARVKDRDQIAIGPVTFSFNAAPEARDAEPSGVDRGEMFAPGDAQARQNLAVGPTEAYPRNELVRDDTNPSHHQPATDRSAPGGSLSLRRTRLRRAWRALPPATRRASLMAGGIVGVAIVVSALRLSGAPPGDRSAALIPLDAATMATRYGLGAVDVIAADRVNFSFTYRGGQARLVYAVGDVAGADTLALRLNGELFAHAPRVFRWTPGVTILLPPRLLVDGTNVLTFDHLRNPPGHEPWAVGEVEVREEPLARTTPR